MIDVYIRGIEEQLKYCNDVELLDLIWKLLVHNSNHLQPSATSPRTPEDYITRETEQRGAILL